MWTSQMIVSSLGWWTHDVFCPLQSSRADIKVVESAQSRWTPNFHCYTSYNVCMFIYWLVVWNMFMFFPYIGNNHPNWRPHIFQRGWNHQPVSSVSLLDIRTYNGLPTSSSSEVEAFLNSPSVPREARRVKRFLASIRRWRKPTENTGEPLWKGRCSAWENEFTHQKMRLTIQKKRNLVPSFWTPIWYT